MLHVSHAGSFKIPEAILGTSAWGLVHTCMALEPGSVSHVVWLNHHNIHHQLLFLFTAEGRNNLFPTSLHFVVVVVFVFTLKQNLTGNMEDISF